MNRSKMYKHFLLACWIALWVNATVQAQFYVSEANSSTSFHYYNPNGNVWMAKSPFPSGPDWGHGLVYNGTYIYATRGGASNLFWRYDLAANTWTALTPPPATVERGGKPLYTSGNDIYLMRGGAGSEFYRYNISTDSWVTLASLPAAGDEGGTLTWDGGNYIYAFRGTAADFYRYSISGNTWTAMASLPEIADDGASLYYISPHIYAIPSGQDASLYRYDITGNTWTALADAPTLLHDGSAFTSDGTDLYTMGGGGSGNPGYNVLYKYTISTDTWSSVGTHPGTISEGASLIYIGGAAGQTTLARQVSASSDDAEEDVADGDMVLTSVDLDILWSTDHEIKGVRFQNVTIPAGATIVSAKLSFYTGLAGNTRSTPVDIHGIKEPNTATFTLTNFDISSRPTTTSSISWTPGTWATAAIFYDTVDISSVVSELVGQAGWASGNAMAFKLSGAAGSVSDVVVGRTWDAGTDRGAVLQITYMNCAPPTATALAQQATCSGGTANSNATLILDSFDALANEVGYSIGTSYSGAAFGSATNISGGAPFTAVNSLSNPSVAQPYTMRVYCDASNYTDVQVLLQPKLCISADLSLTVLPPTQNIYQAGVATYTFTLTNSGPNTAPNVKVKIPLPSNAVYLSAQPQQGSYNATTGIWDVGSVATGSQTLILTLSAN